MCILGAGGMGKTSISLGVVEQPLIKARFLPENIVWVPCIEATSATLFLEILSTQLQVPGNTGQATIEKIISLLATTSTQPSLILLDNFETLYNALDGAQKQVEDILRRLAILSHVAILVTMQGRYPPCNEAINGNRRRSSLLMKHPAFLFTEAFIQIRKMILTSVDCSGYWGTCLLLSHSWRDWPRKGCQQRRS